MMKISDIMIYYAHFWCKEQEWSEALAQHLGGKDFGIALAGGGTRGMALGHGILRSLRETGRSQHFRPIVWIGSVFPSLVSCLF